MSKTFKTFFVIAFFGLNSGSFSQDANEPLLLEIGDRKVNLSEFEAVYKKNNNQSNVQAVEEYLDLYINFRLKVKEAEELGMDTSAKFKKELAGYRRQLSEPYLSDNEVTEELIREAYERLKIEIRASHIMVKLDQNATPADTLTAYKKIESIRKRIVKGEDFSKLAVELSEDPSAKENSGDLGYFSALYMVYQFENAVYKTDVGQVSFPVRTQFGYHLIKVVDKRPSRGEITTAHIMTRIPGDANEADIESARMKSREIFEKLKSGADWDQTAAQFSDDKTTSNKGGVLPAFSSGRMVQEYEEAAFALKNDGDFSEPIQTKFGFHIVKRISLKKLGSYEEMTADLKVRIARDGRSRKSKVAFLNKVKSEYGFKETLAKRDEYYKIIDSTYFTSEWNASKFAELNKEMFRLGDSVVLQTSFSKFLEQNKPRGPVGSNNIFIDQMYSAFKEEFITNYEDIRLENKYSEFRMLMQEYHDGILLFDLTDQKVWSKAVKDSAGLANFYAEHKSENMWGDRIEAVVFNAADNSVAGSVKKNVKARKSKNYTDEDILKMANENSQLNLEIERGKFSKGDNEIVDLIEWKKGISENVESNNRVYFIEVLNLISPEPKELHEVRGLMTSGYQKNLEDNWIKELKRKYPVKVYKEHLSKIK